MLGEFLVIALLYEITLPEFEDHMAYFYKGPLPCGHKGKFPKGKLIVF